MFAITEALSQIETKAVNRQKAVKLKNEFPNKKQLKQIAPALGISSILGTIVGAIPGAGGDIAGFVSYDQAKKFSKKTGRIRKRIY